MSAEIKDGIERLQIDLDLGYEKLAKRDYIDAAYVNSFEGGLAYAIDILKERNDVK